MNSIFCTSRGACILNIAHSRFNSVLEALKKVNETGGRQMFMFQYLIKCVSLDTAQRNRKVLECVVT